MTSSPALTTDKKAQLQLSLLVLVAFVAVNLVISYFTVDGAALRYGGDAGSWWLPTEGLLRHGAFVDPNDPTRLLTFRPPLYPAFAAAMLYISNEAMLCVVVAQVILLFTTGWISRAMTEPWLPGYGNLMLALVVFNPNALATSHLFQSDTLYAFLMTAVFACLMFFARSPNWTTAVAGGALFGLSLLTRTTAQYLLMGWPFAIFFLALMSGGWRIWRRALAMGVLSTVFAVSFLVPWMLHNQRAGEGFVLTSSYLKAYFLWDNISYLEKYDKNIGQTEAERSAEARRDRLAAEYGPGFEKLSSADKYTYLEKRGREQFFSYSARTFAHAFGWAWLQFYGIPGVSNFMNLLGLGEQTAFARYRSQSYDNYIQAGLDALKNASPVFLVLTVAGFLFVLVVRVLGMIGVLTILRRRLWPVLFILGLGLGYFTMVHLFVANSRYRLPIEPLLFLLAIYGLDGWRRRSVTSRASTGFA